MESFLWYSIISKLSLKCLVKTTVKENILCEVCVRKYFLSYLFTGVVQISKLSLKCLVKVPVKENILCEVEEVFFFTFLLE